jgi:hypothetical protein
MVEIMARSKPARKTTVSNKTTIISPAKASEILSNAQGRVTLIVTDSGGRVATYHVKSRSTGVTVKEAGQTHVICNLRELSVARMRDAGMWSSPDAFKYSSAIPHNCKSFPQFCAVIARKTTTVENLCNSFIRARPGWPAERYIIGSAFYEVPRGPVVGPVLFENGRRMLVFSKNANLVWDTSIDPSSENYPLKRIFNMDLSTRTGSDSAGDKAVKLHFNGPNTYTIMMQSRSPNRIINKGSLVILDSRKMFDDAPTWAASS